MSTNTKDETVPYPIPARFEKEDRPEFVELLREAKKRLSLGDMSAEKYACVCWAIEAAARRNNTPTQVSLDLISCVGGALEGENTSSSWLYRKKQITGAHRTSCVWRLQDARHRWVDQMIEDFGGTP